MGRRRFFEAGEMRLALLALIAEQPRHGYDLMTEIETRSGGAYRPSAGSVYPKMQQLEDEGLITSSKEDGKNVYTSTDDGHAEVDRERETIEQIWRRAEEWRDWGPSFHPASMEISRHVEKFAKSAFSAVTRGGVDPDVVRQIIDRAQGEIDQSQIV
jgi:DNA-binding PadR family transcriptional regulator|tara:strand:- start:3569 stop:4039 length:471 start_codon:yes stop_codon:yes gene_type:complete